MSIQPDGRIIHQAPGLYTPPTQNIEGSILEAAAGKTIASNAAQAEAAKSLGAGQKGSGRRRRFRGGGTNLNAHPVNLPSAGTIPGADPTTQHIKAVDNLNQIRADKVGDADINAQPVRLGGRRTKRSRKSKNGRRSKRTHRRGGRKSTHRRRGCSSCVF